jgi:FRG domain
LKEIKLKKWAEFHEAISEVRDQYGMAERNLPDGKVFKRKNKILFRGQSSADWLLETTLERKTNIRLDTLAYVQKATRFSNEIESFTGYRWDLPSYSDLKKETNKIQDSFRPHLACYPYLVYLRHHGFSSPLLDWTESPFIAAFFAYANPITQDASVYCYIEQPNLTKGGTGGSPSIKTMGPYVTTHKRHFSQKAWYTIATQWDYKKKKHYFCSHEDIFQRNDQHQDVLVKIILPSSERKTALSALSDYNINYFTLFQDEEALIKTFAMSAFGSEDYSVE